MLERKKYFLKLNVRLAKKIENRAIIFEPSTISTPHKNEDARSSLKVRAINNRV